MNIKYFSYQYDRRKEKDTFLTSLTAHEVWDVFAFIDGACFGCVLSLHVF